MKRFLQWLEIRCSILRKPTKIQVMTTYFLYREWCGRLTGTKYHLDRKHKITEGPLDGHEQR